MARNKPFTLLDYLALKAPVPYLSDLPAHPLACAHVLRQISDVKAFPLKEWNDAGAYLNASYTPQQDSETAQRVIVEMCLK